MNVQQFANQLFTSSSFADIIHSLRPKSESDAPGVLQFDLTGNTCFIKAPVNEHRSKPEMHFILGNSENGGSTSRKGFRQGYVPKSKKVVAEKTTEQEEPKVLSPEELKEIEKKQKKEAKKQRRIERKIVEKEEFERKENEDLYGVSSEMTEPKESNESPEQMKVEDVEKKPSTSEDVYPEKNSCTKCFRTSQHCENWKEKFRMEKMKTKALTKEIEERKKEDDERDKKQSEMAEEIRQLKELVATMKASAIPAKQVEESQPVRYLTPSYKCIGLSPEAELKLNELHTIKDSIPTLQGKATEKAHKLMNMGKDESNKRMARVELDRILEEFQMYYQSVEKKIEWIKKNQEKPVKQLLPLRESPKFSDSFEKAFNTIVNKELEDVECIICYDTMNDLKETVKCKGCIRRYHKECAWDWTTKGRDQCPTCPMKLHFD